MNKFYILIFFIVAQIACSCHKNKGDIGSDLNEWKLQGNVKSISEIDYSNTGKYSAYLLFNSHGFIQEQTTFNTDGSLIRKWKYEYNTRNQKLIRSCYILNDSLSGVLHYNYNEADKITQEKLLTPAGLLLSNIEHQYDINQNNIEIRFSNDKAKIQGAVLYKYDKSNKLMEELHLDTVTHQNWKQRFTYNKDGLNVEVLYLSLEDSLIKKSTYSYLPNNQVGEACSLNAQNELISKTTYKYDTQENVTLKLICNSSEKTTKKHIFKYTYDKHKNWTFRYEYINDQIDDIISRKLEYYE